jgi:hypothetical protein
VGNWCGSFFTHTQPKSLLIWNSPDTNTKVSNLKITSICGINRNPPDSVISEDVQVRNNDPLNSNTRAKKHLHNNRNQGNIPGTQKRDDQIKAVKLRPKAKV